MCDPDPRLFMVHKWSESGYSERPTQADRADGKPPLIGNLVCAKTSLALLAGCKSLPGKV